LRQDEDVQISDEEDEENFSWGFQESSDNSTPEEEGSPQWSHEEEEVLNRVKTKKPVEEVSEESFVGGGNGFPVRSVG
jgi:hypothetical protein